MNQKSTYLEAVVDEHFANGYSEYQKRYALTVSERDKALIERVERIALKEKRELNILDVGCSTGNFLLHLNRHLKDHKLHGIDLDRNVIEGCKRNPDLRGIDFSVLDMLYLSSDQMYDVVIMSGSLMFFTREEFKVAIKNIAQCVKPGGSLISFDYFHPFEQEVSISMTSLVTTNPKDLTIYFREFSFVTKLLKEAGMEDVSFTPFHLSFDRLPPEDFSDTTSYTVQRDDGKRMCFRGVIYQPWCILEARML
jgi:SAM-dependent methyltransferase